MTVPLDIGIYVPQMGFTFAEVLHRAHRCEELGIGSLWLYDHMYGPGVPGIDSLEAWTLATALLSRTERLRVGHMVLCNQFRHPAVLAKMATTLDQISGGRLELGIGSGSIEDEHHRLGLDWGSFAERSERLRETLEILTQAFAEQRIDFTGTHYTVRDMPIKPGPVQAPRPPIVVGGSGEKYTLPLVARYADVWNVPTYALGEMEHKLAVLRALCEDIGRDPATIVMSVEAVLAIAPDDAALDEVDADRRKAIRWTGIRAARRRADRYAAGDRRPAGSAAGDGLRPGGVVHPRPGIGCDARAACRRGAPAALSLARAQCFSNIRRLTPQVAHPSVTVMSQPLQGRRVVVTGAASGLGAAAVRALSAAGAHVVATYHQTEPTDESQATWLQCDARDAASVDAMIDAAVATMGGLDVLVNAAGLWQQGVPGSITRRRHRLPARHQHQGDDPDQPGRARGDA